MPPSSGRARPPAREVVSAGAVLLGPGKRVLLVHRPKYDDWSFPKGKLDPGEHATAAAVREAAEETGLRIRLGLPLRDQRYPISIGMKTVHYWRGRVLGDPDVSGYRTNAEIDAVRWVDLQRAPRRLTYSYDVATLEEAQALPGKTRALVVLRHGIARARKTWPGRDDRRRPLLVAGRRQAEGLLPILGAYGVRRVVTSSSTRCVQTVQPFAEREGLPVEAEDALSEEDATRAGVRRLMLDLVAQLTRAPGSRSGLVVCAHRPVLPWLLEALDVEDPHLDKGELVVLHLAKGRLVGCERHAP